MLDLNTCLQKLEHQVEVLTAQRSETEATCCEMQAESQHLLERLQAAELVSPNPPPP